MIRVSLTVSKSGEFVSCKARGHALCGVKGSDVVCAAVTALLRTAAEALVLRNDADALFLAPERGSMEFSVRSSEPSASAFLRYTADFLSIGLASAAREYPEALCLKKNIE